MAIWPANPTAIAALAEAATSALSAPPLSCFLVGTLFGGIYRQRSGALIGPNTSDGTKRRRTGGYAVEDQPERILREPEVKDRTGLSRVQRWRRIRAKPPTFPAPVQLGPNSIGWKESDIDRWVNSRPTVAYAGTSSETEKTNEPASSNAPQGGRCLRQGAA
jgi:prophage regulatory protein